jgi:hypothetical protein
VTAPQVLLNHFFVSPDAATFDELCASELVRDLAPRERRTTVRRDRTYTGLYLYGARTYFEFLAPGSTMMGGRSGIAFGVESQGDVERVCERLQPRYAVHPVTRALPSGDEAPWFRACSSDAPLLPRSGVATWVMEYEPAFFERFHPALPPARPGIARADALVRYAAACGQPHPAALEDVVALELSLAADELEAFAGHCAALGYPVDASARGVACKGPGLQLFAAPGAPRGLTAAHLKLRRALDPGDHRIGTTTLSLDGDRAVWRF